MPILPIESKTKDVITKDNITFEEMYLSALVLEGLKKGGFLHPSPVQLKCIPLAKYGSDLVAQAKAGTGKTLVFTIVMLENIKITTQSLPQGLVLTPTREIALQICDVIQLVGSSIPNLQVHPFVGGFKVKEDKYNIQTLHPHIVIGTVGRILELIITNILPVSAIRMFVLDEADLLLGDAFLTDIQTIHKNLPEMKQVMAFSATFTLPLLNVAVSLMRNPLIVRLCGNESLEASSSKSIDEIVNEGEKISETVIKTKEEDDSENILWLHGVTQYYSVIPSSIISADGEETATSMIAHSEEIIMKILAHASFHQAMIFVNHRGHGERLASSLHGCGWPSAFIAGELSQSERGKIMRDFRNFAIRILVTTDLTSRGIDIGHVNFVINIGLPRDLETYLHRIGRTGRFGSLGVSVNIITPSAVSIQEHWTKKLKMKIEVLPEVIPATLYVGAKSDDEEEGELEKHLNELEEIRQNFLKGDNKNSNNNDINDKKIVIKAKEIEKKTIVEKKVKNSNTTTTTNNNNNINNMLNKKDKEIEISLEMKKREPKKEEIVISIRKVEEKKEEVEVEGIEDEDEDAVSEEEKERRKLRDEKMNEYMSEIDHIYNEWIKQYCS